MNKIKNIITKGYTNVTTHWKTPMKGRELGYKEILSLAFGSLGGKAIVLVINAMMLGIGNTLISNTIGIPPVQVGIIYAISVIISFPLGSLRASLIDRSRMKKGKYLPFLLIMGVPTVLLGVGFVWMPYHIMSTFAKCITVLLFNIGFQFFYMFFQDSFDSLPSVLSSNTIERSDVIAIKSVVANFAPTIINAILPFVAKLVTGEDGNLADISIYRVFYPIILIFSFGITMIIYFNTQERVIVAKTHIIKVKVIDSLRAVSKNKYFWIIAIATSTALLETAYGSLLWWMYNYQNATTAGGYSIITLVYGNASLWPMLLAPLAIRAFGKKKLLVTSNLCNIGFILCLLPIMMLGSMRYMIWVVLVCMFVNSVATMMSNTLDFSIQSDIRDYQQYISGERMDGIFVYQKIISNFATMLFAFVMLFLQDWAGLNEEIAQSLGYSGHNVYDVLYNEYYFRRITSLLIVISAVGACMNVIPYFFYDMTENKQRSIVSVLRIRAFFEDFGNNNYTNEKLIESVDIINSAEVNKDKEINKLTRKDIKTARKAYRISTVKLFIAKVTNKKAVVELKVSQENLKAKLKQEKLSYKEKSQENKDIEMGKFVYKEINKYNTAIGMAEYDRAVETTSQGVGNYINTSFITIEEARALPKDTLEDKESRKREISKAKNFISAKKLVGKHYNGKVEEFDKGRFDNLLKPLNECEQSLLALYKEHRKAKKDKDTATIIRLNEEIKVLKNNRTTYKKELKVLTNEHSLYVRAIRPYIEAENIIKQRTNYLHLEEVITIYNDIKSVKE